MRLPPSSWPEAVRLLPPFCLLLTQAGACLSACGPSEPLASAAEIERAKQVYTQCVEDELGLKVEELEITRSGDITVRFAPGSDEQKQALAVSICEPRIGSVLEPGGSSVLGPPPNLGHPGSDEDVQTLLRDRAGLGFEGAVLAEFSGERRVDTGFGTIANGSARTPDSNTAFDCGSIMKEVTAAGIFLLEEAGSLTREQTLDAFFADVPSAWRSVTVNEVLNHSAGFAEYHDTEGDFEPMDRATALAKIFAPEPRFEPGTERAYSNAGYTLLAALIEKVTGEAYLSFVERRIFEPLGMTRSGFYGDPLWTDGNVAVGRGADVYLGNDPSRWPPPSWALIGNGGLVSTLEDLLKLAKALDGEGLFQPKTQAAYRLARTAGSIAGKALFGYAGGNDFGFDAVVGEVPEDSSYVIVASHLLSPVSAEILGVELLQVLYGDVLQQPKSE